MSTHGRLASVLVLAALAGGCQSAAPIEQARTATTTFTRTAPLFVPPPRSIADIVAALDAKREEAPSEATPEEPGPEEGSAPPEKRRRGHRRGHVSETPPATEDPAVLARYYFRRGQARARHSQLEPAIEDLTTAAERASVAGAGDLEAQILLALSNLEVTGGSFARTIEHLEQAAGRVTAERGGLLVLIRALQARRYAQRGYMRQAEKALRQAAAVRRRAGAHLPKPIQAQDDSQIALARGEVAWRRGRLGEAERALREGLRVAARSPRLKRTWYLENATSKLAVVLSYQGRLLEAEVEARHAVLGTLEKLGRNHVHTANTAITLSSVLAQQGRYADAEALVRVALDVYRRVGASDGSRAVGRARKALALALVGQARWADALAEYDWIRDHAADAPAAERLLNDPEIVLALVRGGRLQEGLEIAERVITGRSGTLGRRDPVVVVYRGLRAVILAERGEPQEALAEFGAVTPLLLARAPEADDETSSRTTRDRRMAFILDRHVRLLAEAQGTPLAAGMDPVAEAFRLAEVVRGRAVERALDASAARAAAATPTLAALVRRQQDAGKQLAALYGGLASLLTVAHDQADARTAEELRAEIGRLRAERAAADAEIRSAFPAYAELVRPSPATLDRVRAALRAGEALVALFASEDRTLVWGVRATGPVAFASAPLGRRALADAVAKLRHAMDAPAQTLGDIPEFDLATAYGLYRRVLEPVRSAWEASKSLIVVPDGPLGQLPFALLPTAPVTLGPEQGALFSRYRRVPWLVRTHAVTVLPSAGALATLRALPPAAADRRPFVGFGDPYFSTEQAREADEAATATRRRGAVGFRNLGRREGERVGLGTLPRLPDTAEEILSMARALGADPARDVFLGRRATEAAVEQGDLGRYRVVAFATHGLVAGDLDGLTQPALALTSPEVTPGGGDGLLTLENILGLSLDADWVVLSACNTASGNGAGSEAVSGLGRAFFYAGARALLVSHWAVETTSARALTTELFRRQAAAPQLARSRALQQTLNWMIDDAALSNPATGQVLASYAHPIFWAPFVLVGDGGSEP